MKGLYAPGKETAGCWVNVFLLFSTRILVISGLCSLGDSKELFKYQQIEKVTCYGTETLLITEVS